MRVLARQTRPNEQPGVEYEYSNTGYFLLGVVIARVSGQSLACGYAKTDRGFAIDETAWEQVGDGQVHSDLHDLALWDQNFYTGKLGGRALVENMVEAGALNSGKRILSAIVLCNRDDADTTALATLVAQHFLKNRLAPAATGAEEPEKEPPAASWQPRDLAHYAEIYFSVEADARCALPDGGAGVEGFVYDQFGLRGLPFKWIKEPSE